MPGARKTDVREERLPGQLPGAGGNFAGFLAAIVIAGAVIALAVLFWTAIG